MLFIEEFKKITYNCFKKGWNEMNGGNISYRLSCSDVTAIKNEFEIFETIKLNETMEQIKGQYFLMTASGKFFQNVTENIEQNAGIIKVNEDGNSYTIVWGFKNCKPTSELPTHLLNHNEICKKNNDYKIILHGHQTNLILLSALFEDEDKLTKELWKMMTECLIVFPNGIKLINWMVPGTYEIGQETSKYINDYDLVFWKNHGGFIKGKSFDHAFGLIDTIEKSAFMYTELLKINKKANVIEDENLKTLAKAFKVSVPSRYGI